MPHLYQEIAESIRLRIATGDLPPGGRLPSVRDMAEEWQCTPGTVNRAYRELAEEGLIGGHRGSGTHVLDSNLAGGRPELQWAGLVNRAEQYLLEALNSGHTPMQAQSALAMAVGRWQAMQHQNATEPGQQPADHQIRFAGSHDLAVELLVELLDGGATGGTDPRMTVDYVGSLGGLIALAQHDADVAGIHLWDATTASYNRPYIRRILPGRRLNLVTLTQRQLGLIMPRGNPQQIAALNDLTRPGVRLIHRQPGSGTRIWLDEQLRLAGIRRHDLEVCDVVEATHMGVARAIQSGEATVGLGIQAAAAAYGLAFLPLTEELYQLVVPESVWGGRAWQSLLAIVLSEQFAARVNNLGGYNTAATGEISLM